jgi:hypothetical protein
MRSTARDPFACRQCSHLLISSLDVRRDALSVWKLDQELDQLPSLRMKPPWIMSRPPYGSGAPSQSARSARRFASWSDTRVWGNFQEEIVDQLSDDDYLGVNRRPYVAVAKAFNYLINVCADHDEDLGVIIRRLSLRPEGDGKTSSASAVAVALCKTGLLYRLSNALCPIPFELRNPWEHPRPKDKRGRIGFPEHFPTEDLERVDFLEVLGVFALNLIAASRFENLDNEYWCRQYHHDRFVPAWQRYRDPDGRLKMRIRPRVNESVVTKLINRYANRVLSISPHQVFRPQLDLLRTWACV